MCHVHVPRVLQVVFNDHGVGTRDVMDEFEDNFKITSPGSRLPPHPNILRSLTQFVDQASAPPATNISSCVVIFEFFIFLFSCSGEGYWEGKVLLYMYPTSLYREEW
jgi:hypothetical protein